MERGESNEDQTFVAWEAAIERFRTDPDFSHIFGDVRHRLDQAIKQRGPFTERQNGWDLIEKLRDSIVYYVGIPPHQTSIEEDYFKTNHALRLMKELMWYQARTGNLHLVIAAPTANIWIEREDDAAEHPLSSAKMIGLKEILFYEAVQDWLLTTPGGEALKRVPLSHSTDITDEFSGKVVDGDGGRLEDIFEELEELLLDHFNNDSDFRELVYRCVMPGQRHRRHRTACFNELIEKSMKSADPNEYSPLKMALARCEYVIYQIALVLLAGGEKWGPPREKYYDEAALSAKTWIESNVGPSILLTLIKRANFHVGRYLESGVDVPYHSKTGPEAVMRDDTLTRFQSTGPLVELRHQTYAHFETLASTPISEAQKQTQLEDFLEETRWKYAEVSQRLERDRTQNEFIWQRMAERARRHPLLPRQDWKDDMESTLLRRSTEHHILSLLQDPYTLERLLLERSGLKAIALGEAGANLNGLPTTMSRWFPVTCEAQAKGVPDGRYFADACSQLLQGRQRQATVSWQLPLHLFEEVMANRFLLRPPYHSSPHGENRVRHELHRLFHEHESRWWTSLGDLFTAIEDSPLESIYQRYLSQWTGLPPIEREDDGTSEERSSQAQKILERNHLNPRFSDFMREGIHAMR